MSSFISELVVECVNDLACDGRGIWKVTEPFIYQSDILARPITVEAGFLTDFASVPRIPFLPIIYEALGDTAHKAAVLHDWLYHHHEVCGEQSANNVFREACEVEGIPKWRFFCLWAGVSVGGKSSWSADGHNAGHNIVNGEIA